MNLSSDQILEAKVELIEILHLGNEILNFISIRGLANLDETTKRRIKTLGDELNRMGMLGIGEIVIRIHQEIDQNSLHSDLVMYFVNWITLFKKEIDYMCLSTEISVDSKEKRESTNPVLKNSYESAASNIDSADVDKHDETGKENNK